MTDREKILIWLDKCIGVCNENTNCELCPFNECGTYDYSCAEQLENAIRRELLNEQTIRPVQGASPRLYFCPDCEKQIVDLFVYCPYCGKRVLWDE